MLMGFSTPDAQLLSIQFSHVLIMLYGNVAI